MQEQEKVTESGSITRRDFIQTVAASGAGLMLSQAAFGQASTTSTAAAKPAAPAPKLAKAPAFLKNPGDVINVGIIGVGAEGQVLLDACLFKDSPLPNLKFKAVCDIWDYSRKRVSGGLRARGHQVNQYIDYKEMLEKEKDLHAMIVATPDWMHAEHANACMEAGLHVYCEKEMSNSLEKARSMVDTKNKTGKLLQIGHQRRSNPRYLYALDNIIKKNKILGNVGLANAQWNRSKWASRDLECTKKIEVPQETLLKYGYESMHHLLNWRWYKKYGGGPIVDLGSHQIDIFAWVFEGNPKSVQAIGGNDLLKHDWYDSVMCLYEYITPQGMTARAFYQVLTNTSNGGFAETFMGDEGTLVMSEDAKKTKVLREALNEDDWSKWNNDRILTKKAPPVLAAPAANSKVVVDPRASKPPEEWEMPIELPRPAHQPHLENFFNAIRLGNALNCPAEIGYETAVAVLAVNRAIAEGKKIEFRPEEFKVEGKPEVAKA